MPLEVRNGKVRMTFLGDSKQFRALLKTCDSIGLQYEVSLLTDASFSPRAILGCLTEKQRLVLLSAFQQGYYDMPRRISSQGLARRLGLRSSTLIEHRRKAEHRLFANLLSE